MRALLVLSVERHLERFAPLFSRNDFHVHTAETSDEALKLARLYKHDIIIVAHEFGEACGIDLLERMRVAGVETPAIVLTRSVELSTKLTAFRAGADDVLSSPFSNDELMARSRAVIRRTWGHGASRIRIGRLTVDVDAKVAEVDGERLNITNREYAVLELLALRKGTTIKKDEFLSEIYDGRDEPEPKIIDVFICKLRKKLALHCGGNPQIETIWGRGYMLREAAEDNNDLIGVAA
ncbi:MAG: response regulator transcription factor [Alphaproteobacteria bacterium]|nr:response regulator transcription factor [Alphaproteobacteria bacterium]